MTELHNNNNHTYSSSTTSFDWFDRNNNNNQQQQQQQQQLPPIHFASTTTTTEMSNNNTTEQGFHNNNSMMDEDMITRRSQHHYGASSSTPGSWMNNNNQPTTTTTSTGYSPTRDSCDLSYDGNEEYPHHHHHNHGQPTPSPSASTERSRSKKHRTPSTRDIHVEKNTEGKPPYSYATLIKYAIENSSRKKLTLSEIYQWVIDHYPYYGSAGTGWKNSIRHNLSLNKSFVRVPRPINEPGKGSYWQVDYRAAEAELRSKSNLAVRGRANRSGSDPYRQDSSWASLNNNNNSFNPRINRDARSLSMDSSMNQKAPPHGFSASSSSSSSSSAAAAAAAAVAAATVNINGTPTTPTTNNNNHYHSGGYYNHHGNSGYGYTRHNSLNNRHSADYSRSSYIGYEMYGTTSVDGTLPHQHHYNHHQQQQHNNNRMQLVPMYDNNNNTSGSQSTYGQPIYSPANYTQSYNTLNDKESEEQQQTSFSTPQPHYRRVTSNSSPSLSTIKQEKSSSSNHSPSPPQPTMDTSSKRGKGLNNKSTAATNVGGDDYNWIA